MLGLRERLSGEKAHRSGCARAAVRGNCELLASPPAAQAEAKAGLKARVETELSAAQDDAALKEMRDRFSAEERALEHSIGALVCLSALHSGRELMCSSAVCADHTVHSFSAALDVEYNFLSK